jgi:hypothetical protein
VDEAVNRILRTPKRANTSCHATILRLSRSATGRPQIVTTNFDHLFERVEKSLQVLARHPECRLVRRLGVLARPAVESRRLRRWCRQGANP